MAVKNSSRITIIPNNFQKQYTIDLMVGLAESGVEVDFLGSDLYDVLKAQKAIHYLDIRGSADGDASRIQKFSRVIAYYGKLLYYTLKTRNKVYHFQWFRFLFFEGIVLNLVFKCLGKKIVYTAHNLLPHNKNSLYNRMVFRAIYHTVDRIVVLTEALKKDIVQKFGIRENKISIVEHGVYRVPTTPSLSREKARESLGLEGRDRVILFFGKISRYKGLDLLLEAFSSCRRQIASLKLIVAGMVGRSYRTQFDRLISNAGATSLVVRPEYIPDSEVEILFKAADIIVLPYLEGSQSGVLFLSYAYGRPVVASDIGGFPQDVLCGKTGFLFQTGSATDLADKIAACFLSGFLDRENLEESIRAFAFANYSWKKSAEDLKRIYEICLNDPRG